MVVGGYHVFRLVQYHLRDANFVDMPVVVFYILCKHLNTLLFVDWPRKSSGIAACTILFRVPTMYFAYACYKNFAMGFENVINVTGKGKSACSWH